MKPSVIVVGGGAAGLTAALYASERGAKVCVLEKMGEVGKKILISGGTRCNVMPGRVDLQRDYFTSVKSQSAMKAVFRSWTLEECHEWMTSPEELGLELELEQETEKYFPRSDSARDVRDALLRTCLRKNVAFEYGCGVKSVRRREDDDVWECITQDERSFCVDRVIMASGGKSYPKIGTDGIGYSILKKLGHTLVAPCPALTPLLAEHPGSSQLSGVSLQTVQVTARNVRTNEKCQSLRSGLLFTHRGISGPSVLDISHFISCQTDLSNIEVTINWTGEDQEAWHSRFKDSKWKGAVANYVQRCGIPSRLASALCQDAQIPRDKTLSHLTKTERRDLVRQLVQHEVRCTGHGGFRLAEVTSGGVPFEEIHASSMESRKAPGVFICGELMDVFGRIGGFNFYWAWVSGRLAGISAAL